jgi:hypothetical protein
MYTNRDVNASIAENIKGGAGHEASTKHQHLPAELLEGDWHLWVEGRSYLDPAIIATVLSGSSGKKDWLLQIREIYEEIKSRREDSFAVLRWRGIFSLGQAVIGG